MKFKFVATEKDLTIFAIFAVFLLYLIAISVLNIQTLSADGTFYGLNPIPAFFPDNIAYTLILYLVSMVGLLLSVKSYFFEFEKGFGFRVGKVNSGGYSDWANVKEIKNDKDVVRVLASDDKIKHAGTPLISNGTELWVDNGEFHTLVIGSTGSGKTQCIVLPQLRTLIKAGESIIVTDPKGELYEDTGEMLRANGYNVILLNFRSPQRGNCWNPLDLPYRLYKAGNFDKGIELIDDLALNILYDEKSQNDDPFWQNTAADYFTGISLALFEDAPENQININSINLTSSVGDDKFGGSTYIKEYFNYKEPTSAAYVNAIGTVAAPSDTKGSIISVFKQKVKLFATRENLTEMLSYSDFDISTIGKEKTAVFIIIQDEKKTYHSLATIFIKQAYETLIDVAQHNGGKLPIRTNFILDEFANMPPLKDVTTMITAARSKLIRFTLIIQNFAQLNQVYGKDEAETIKGNCGNIIYLISTELAALEEISKLCGEKKSKKDDKTASTPLVTVSDLQRMKQFDQILLRLRKNPFKHSFVPDFKIDWGGKKYPKAKYNEREKRKIEVFDIREFVKAKKNEKLNEMMASINKDKKDDDAKKASPDMDFGYSPDMDFGYSPFGFNGENNKPTEKRNSKPDLSVSDLVAKIDAKLNEIEEEERKEKERKEKARLEKQNIKVTEEICNRIEADVNKNIEHLEKTYEEKPKITVENNVKIYDNPSELKIEKEIAIEPPKPVATIKLEDISEDEKFFDDFFDD